MILKLNGNGLEITHDDNNENLPNFLTVKDSFDLLDFNNINHPQNDSDNIPMNHKESTIEKFKNISFEKKSDGFSSRGSSNRLKLFRPRTNSCSIHSSFQIHPTEHRSITVREGATITSISD